MPKFPSLTKTWHSDTYDAINPTRPELAVWKGKVIVITGGGGAIGGATALAFARAGASKIAVIGRRQALLEATKAKIENQVSNTSVLTIQGDVTSPQSMQDAMSTVATKLGKIDVLVVSSGFLADFAPIATVDPDDWWTAYQVNIRGSFNLARAFLPHAADKSVVVDVSTGVVHIPSWGTASSHSSSNVAATKLWETFGVENENVDIVHLHPGGVESEMNIKSGIPAMDKASLAGDFIVWTVSPEAKKFRGKFLWANWDVEELKQREEELTKPEQLTIALVGWPFE